MLFLPAIGNTSAAHLIILPSHPQSPRTAQNSTTAYQAVQNYISRCIFVTSVSECTSIGNASPSQGCYPAMSSIQQPFRTCCKCDNQDRIILRSLR
ncbi:hypothetical protein M404DRAFT_992436 [Pisolithus tinctorius Marx 270]|uniref:Uncharacterized protein n=1 Tax=Pisolithus tinctorius Marx 270 TaxID=870435 RepID=A0A0C3PYD5_PISTI|nr:hypothetical protein M404DRAFT_992436 [Pisolithus tinctorius Marx 270]